VQAPFSSSGECVPIENSIGLHGAWKALKLFFFFSLHPAGVQLRASATIEHYATVRFLCPNSYLFLLFEASTKPSRDWQPHLLIPIGSRSPKSKNVGLMRGMPACGMM
jgi:hypothetical protein